MRLSNGVEWAAHCCVLLSQATRPVPAARLAEFHGVSPTYLAKHLQALTRAGITSSVEGPVGGYALTRDPAAVTLGDVVAAIDGDQPAFRCTEIRQRGPLAASPAACATPCPIAAAMAVAESAYRDALGAVSIADLAADVERGKDGALARLRTWLVRGEEDAAVPSPRRARRR
jgi:Rrf2 family protein